MRDGVLETARLVLEPLSRANRQFIARWAMDPEVTRFLGYETPASQPALRAHVETLTARTQQPDYHIWVVFRSSDHEALGQVALHPGDQPGRYALGYEFQRAAWGRGYASEAVQAVLDYGFTQMQVGFVYATHDQENPASGAVMDRCGMRFLSMRQGCDIKPGLENRTMIRKYITREQWACGQSDSTK